MTKSIQVNGFVVEYGQVNDVQSQGWRGEYTIRDSFGEPISGCRTENSYPTAWDAEVAAKEEGVARSIDYANAKTEEERSALRDEDEQNAFDRGAHFVP
jgi:hypothetical protein